MARFNFHKGGEDNSFLKHLYPDDKLYCKGVVTTTTMLERKKPTVKKWNSHLHSEKLKVTQDKDVFEVLMLDRQVMLLKEVNPTCSFSKAIHW